MIVKKCPHCSGNKVVDHTAHLTLEITPGMPEAHEVVFYGEADESPDWEAGDVVLRVRSRKSKGGWRRKESSLYWKETIGVDEASPLVLCQFAMLMILQALLGFDRNITHLDGRIVRLVRKGVTQPGKIPPKPLISI